MTFDRLSVMETRTMKIRPLHIKAVLLRLEATPDLLEAGRYLISKGLRPTIICHPDAGAVRQNWHDNGLIREDELDVIISPDAIMPRQAVAKLIHKAIHKMNIAAETLVFISPHDSEIKAARRAGAITVRIRSTLNSRPAATAADFEIENIAEIKDVVRMGIPLPAGKLPNRLLQDFLDQFIFDDTSVLINPGVGEDIAAIDIESQEVLILKSDPITFATDSIGQYAVIVNANDIATSGATPRWLLATLFFPCGTTASQIHFVFEELKSFCRQSGITLCGGHTELTDAVTRPIVAGMMAGTVDRRNMIDKRRMEKGDQVLLTKGVAVEGTAIIAREFGDRLKSLGMAAGDIDRCRRFLDHLSIITEAKIAAASSGTSAMHDVTEGGLAAALEELSIAGGHSIRVDTERIPVYPETEKICGLLGINPLGLIGSGSLLICCRKESCKKLMERIAATGVAITPIGEVMERGEGIKAYKRKKQTPWPAFEVDEITKLFI